MTSPTTWRRIDRKLRRARLTFENHRARRKGLDQAGIRDAMTECEVLSLDVFDTALLRLVASEDVFEMVRLAWVHDHPGTSEFDFGTARHDAQRRAWTTAHNERQSEETTLDETYSAFVGPGDWDPAVLQELEVAIEIDVARANQPILDLYREALRLGKRVIFVSDMYLPSSVIDRMLRQNGYLTFDAIYVSGEIGKTKASGGLFRFVAEELRIPPDRFLHLGDRFESDVVAARKSGWRAFHVPAPTAEVTRRAHGIDDIFASLCRGLSTSDVTSRGSTSSGHVFWDRFGYEVAGPLMVGFTRWVAKAAQRHGVRHVFFLARDGWILKKVYDAQELEPPASYLYASRRAFNIPAITAIDDNALDVLLNSPGGDFTVGQYLERIGLVTSSCLSEIARAGFASADEVIALDRPEDRLRALMIDLSEPILARSSLEREALQAYIEQVGLLPPGQVAVVDLGWQGTLQSALASVLDDLDDASAVGMVGLYLGTFAVAERLRRRGLLLEGFLTSFGEPLQWNRLITTCLAVWELLHTAEHGSVLFFEQTERGVEPVMAPHDVPESMREVLGIMQEGVLRFARDFAGLDRSRPWMDISPAAAAGPISRVLNSPTRQEAIALGDLTHAIGMGSLYRGQHLARPPSWRVFCRHPAALIREYKACYWKVGYRRRLLGPSQWLASTAERAISATRSFRRSS